jgi:bacterioferritin
MARAVSRLVRTRDGGRARGKSTEGEVDYCVKGSRDAIDALNKMLFNELTAIDQYFLHARMLRHWGLHDLGEIVYQESIGEMRHADWLIERILFLDGLPNLQDLGKLRIGEDAAEVLKSDLVLEMTARNDTAAAIALFERESDYASRDIATRILIDSEEHVDFLERQLDLVRSLGLPNYLQSAMGPMKNQLQPDATGG